MHDGQITEPLRWGKLFGWLLVLGLVAGPYNSLSVLSTMPTLQLSAVCTPALSLSKTIMTIN